MSLGTGILLALWALFAASVILRLRRRGTSTFDDVFTPTDRRLVGSTALYFAVPGAVLASQLVQVVALEVSGAGLGHFSTWIYWGVAEPAVSEVISTGSQVAIAAAGPLTLIAVGLGLVAWTRWAPGNAAENFLRLESARMIVSLALGVHVLASLLVERGDYWTLRTTLNEMAWLLGDGVLLLAGLLGLLSLYAWRRAESIRLLGTTSWDARRALETHLTRSPEDVDAWIQLGCEQLGCGDPRAVQSLERARELAPEDARVELWLGRLHLHQGDPSAAASHLRRAGQLIETTHDEGEPLLFEVMVALSRARLMLGDGEGALMTAEAATDARPGDPLAVILLADTLIANGRRDEARDQLRGGLGRARGRWRLEIERRLKALQRR